MSAPAPGRGCRGRAGRPRGGRLRVQGNGLRQAFGVPVGSFQHSKFLLAEMATELAMAHAFTDKAIMAHADGELTTQQASMVKWWNTELCNRVTDRCVQLHGGYGYMREYPVARAWADSRVTIYGGTTEIQKEIIGRGLGL